MTREQFEPLVRAYSNTVYRVAYQALKNHADAEDVMQTVLLKLFETATVFESQEHIRARPRKPKTTAHPRAASCSAPGRRPGFTGL